MFCAVHTTHHELQTTMRNEEQCVMFSESSIGDNVQFESSCVARVPQLFRPRLDQALKRGPQGGNSRPMSDQALAPRPWGWVLGDELFRPFG